ncbi:hypothetical protein KY289_007425 [Solanum tuberosum]|nr:hypothetical protein KY289_007425 [Solanum tuberosum]
MTLILLLTAPASAIYKAPQSCCTSVPGQPSNPFLLLFEVDFWDGEPTDLGPAEQSSSGDDSFFAGDSAT